MHLMDIAQPPSGQSTCENLERCSDEIAKSPRNLFDFLASTPHILIRHLDRPPVCGHSEKSQCTLAWTPAVVQLDFAAPLLSLLQRKL